MKVFTVPSGTDTSTLFLGIIFGLLSFAGFEAASTLGEETNDPQRDIPRAILWTAIFGGIYFTVVTAIEMMAFGTDDAGSRELHRLAGALRRRPRDVVHRLLGGRPDHPRRLRLGVRAAAWPASSVPRGCCSRSAATWRRVTRSAGPARTRTPAAAAVVVSRHGLRDRPHRRGVLRREAVRHVPLERHHRHPDPAGRLPAGDVRLHQADLDRQEDAAGADLGDRHPDRGAWW